MIKKTMIIVSLLFLLIFSIDFGNFHGPEIYEKMAWGANNPTDQPYHEKTLPGVGSLLEKVITVTDQRYGAKGNGITDDSKAIQSAIEAAVKSRQSNIVYVPPGTYVIRKRINIRQNVQLKGSGNQTVFKLPGNFPIQKNIGYAAFGFAEDLNDYPNQYIFDNFKIDMSEAPDDCVGIWFNKKGWKVGISNLQISSQPSKRHQGILVPAQRYNDAGEPIGHANHNHCIFDNIGFVGLQHPDGVFCVAPNNDAQNWLMNNLAFMRCGFHLNFGGLNSSVQQVYFNTPLGNVLRADGKGGKYPRVKLTNSSGPVSFRDCYFEGGPDMYVWTTNSANAMVRDIIFKAVGRNMVGPDHILNTTRNPISGIKTSERAFEVNGNAAMNPNYYRTGGKVWIETDKNMKKYTIESVEYEKGEDKTRVKVDADLDDGIVRIYRQLQNVVANE
jgi:hypothetical protein